MSLGRTGIWLASGSVNALVTKPVDLAAFLAVVRQIDDFFLSVGQATEPLSPLSAGTYMPRQSFTAGCSTTGCPVMTGSLTTGGAP